MVVQEFLRGGGRLEELAERFHVSAKRHPRFPSLVLLKYSQIDSPFQEPIVRECRGLILDEADNWRAVSLAFPKFFNHGEVFAAPVDWRTAVVQEKLDGSLCVLYWHAGEWHVATSGTPDAGGSIGLGPQVFRELFWSVFEKLKLQLPPDTTRAWSFELTAPQNRVVVPHKEERLTLLGVRDMTTLKEDPVAQWAHLYPVVKSFPLTSFDDILGTFATFEPMTQEGYVVVDAQFNRVKVKHPGYVAIHHLKDGMSTRRILELVRASETPEFLSYFPEWTAEFDRIRSLYEGYVSRAEADFEPVKSMPNDNKDDKKAFALAVRASFAQHAMFAVRAGKSGSLRQFFAEMNINSLMAGMGMKNVEVQE